MNTPFRKSLLPGAIVFMIAFTALNLAFPWQKDNPLFAKMLLMGNREIKPASLGIYGTMMIRYVGFTIIVSATAGIATAASYRRLQVWRDTTDQRQEQLVLKLTSLGENDPIALSQIDPEAQAIHATANPSEQPEVESEVSWDPQSQNACAGYPECTQNCAPCAEYIQQIELQQPYQTCRIRVPHMQQSLFAIASGGLYYRFLKVEKTPDNALNFLTRLTQKGEQAVVTRTKNGYAVWLWEPNGYSDVMA